MRRPDILSLVLGAAAIVVSIAVPATLPYLGPIGGGAIMAAFPQVSAAWDKLRGQTPPKP